MKISARKDLQAHREIAYVAINRSADAAREALSPWSAAQSDVYRVKVAEAKEILSQAEVESDATRWPFLTAEAAASGLALADLAHSVLAQNQRWLTASAEIEAWRISTKNRVRDSVIVADMQAASQLTR